MFAKTFTIDNVIQNKVTFISETKQFNDLNHVEEVIRSLDGVTTTTVTFEQNSNSYLCICGADDNFVLYTINDKGMFMPVNVDYGNLFPDEISINVSGCLSKLSKDLVLDLETTINIAKAYAESGELVERLEDKFIEWMNTEEYVAR